jgi:hypothetical protein
VTRQFGLITQRGGDQLRAFVRVRRVRRQFFTHGFVAGLRLSSLRDLRLGVDELPRSRRERG